MTKRTKIFIGIVSLLILGFISIFIADSFLYVELFSQNSLEVRAAKPLDLNKVQIQKGNWTINRANDKILFDRSPGNELIFSKGCASNIHSDYGENDFLVIYDAKYYYQFRHFIFNRRHYHDYHFHLDKVEGEIKLSVIIEGLDEMKFERNMNLISHAEEMKTNVSKEKAGTIYNMKELETK